MTNLEKEINKLSAGISEAAMERLNNLFGICLYKLNLKTNDIRLTLNTTRVTGHNYDDLPINNFTRDSMIVPEDRALVEESYRTILSGEKDHYHIEYRMHRKDSSIVWLEEVGIVSERDEAGRPVCVSAIAADLSRLKWAETKAREMEEAAARLARGMDDASLADENRLLYAANAAGATIIGGFHNEYETVLHQAVQMLGESLTANYACIWRNERQKEKTSCFIRVHWSTRGRNLGSEKGGRQFLYDEFLPDWNKLVTENSYYTFSKGENGVGASRIFAKDGTAFVAAGEHKPYVFGTGGGLSQEFMRDCDMGDAGSVLLVPIYLHDDFWGMAGFVRSENAPFKAYEVRTVMTGVAIVAASVSRNETFGKINMDRDKAIAGTLAKGEFLSRMSHELRTPLNAIIGMTNIALREKDPKKVFGYIKKVENSSQLLLNVINDILDMSKIEAGKMDIVMEAFDFNAMLRSAETIIRVKTDEKKQKLTVKLDESLNRAVISDEHRLLQVLVNLLSNANKFTPEGGEIGVTMTVRPTENENRVKIGMEVRDNGIGLTQEQQERLFRAFEQADGSITRKYGGTGLGLAICKKILLALGGDIWVKSKPNQGACFMFELETELGGAVEAADGDARQPLDGKTGTPDWRGKTLLLAEDVDINREIVEIMLEDTGIKVVSAANGREALDLFTADPAGFDLILMDVQMPVMDGLSATKLLRELNTPNAKTVPIVAMTANAFKEDVDQCIASGMDGHIAKPIVIESFFEVLKAFLH